MEQRVRYCKTSDGVDIAYTTYGEGPPIVVAPSLLVPHLQMELDYRQHRSFYERLSRRLKVIRYDARGTGMSQRDVIDFSHEAGERDLQAVLNRLEIGRTALYTHVIAGGGALAFAARSPERVTSLVWWVGGTVYYDPRTRRQLSAIAPLMESEWELFVHVAGRLLHGWDSPDASVYGEIVRAGHTPDSWRAAADAVKLLSNAEFVFPEEIRVPTLVAHMGEDQDTARTARKIAATIPTAYVVAIPGTPSRLATFAEDNEILIGAIADFVESAASGSDAPVPAPQLDLNAMRAILWTDLEGHSAMMERLGDARGRDILREHERITRDALTAHGGTEVKAMGDGFMAWFASAGRALDCAIALQRAITASDASEHLRVRVGINAGEPIADEDPDGRTDLFGASVIAAARICNEASGGEIIVSDVVRQLLAGKDYLFAERRAVALKGFEEPVRLYEVPWRESSH